VPTLSLPDLDLYYERRGSGSPLLLFNGSGSTIESSAPLIDVLASHFDVLVHDQRCLGRTSVPETQPTMSEYASDAEALLEHIGWPSALVFGISFGGMVAQELAVTHPKRVRRLALLCTSPGGDGGSSYPLHALAELDSEERAARSLRVMDTRFDETWLEAHPADRVLVDVVAARAAQPRTGAQRRGEAMQLEARRTHDVWDRLDRIECPTLVMFGEYDGIAPPDNSRSIQRRIAGSVLRGYEGGHVFLAQDLRAFPDVVDFLSHE
jgi:pimeloyl-ACP methyl ester carboxylesterase